MVRTGRVGALGALVIAALMLSVGGGVAAASATPRQACNPTYGCTTTTAPSGVFTCNAVWSGNPPTSVTVSGIPVGAPVHVVFNGAILASSIADSHGSATVNFTVPPGVAGTLIVQGEGATFTATCDPPITVSGVLPVSSGGVLAHTGVGVLLLLLAALALLVAGYLARRQGRRT